MKAKTFMIIAGEASGDALAAELVGALRQSLSTETVQPVFFGVGGSRMTEAGVELIFDFARNAVFGIEALLHFRKFLRQFAELRQLAIERQPDVIICVDFGGFNRRFAHAVKEHVRRTPGGRWNPKIVQYVSPQVWASRPGRAVKLARDVDLLLSIFPFEKQWYAERVPAMRVEFVGHPAVDRYGDAGARARSDSAHHRPTLVILPGSRRTELKRHLPVLSRAVELMRAVEPTLKVRMIVPRELSQRVGEFGGPADVEVSHGNLAEALRDADVAIAKSGTVTLECAVLGVPSVVMYKTSWLTYEIARRIIQVKFVAMPNLLADEAIFPEFLQEAARAEDIAHAALEFLTNDARRKYVKGRLQEIVASLGGPGASGRAAGAILNLMGSSREDAAPTAGS